ncbi:hypothetical protein [Burkholderia thailandensis]|uniref:hypothetical protein n=1 Tax=Burkholderia thailandensis TaxID=57975 RepID=UPI0022AC2005|nr:hypothetical protein [Burkholderia thailandensis]MCZ2903224.1 hypothetical protein [Burkholderia thailandensis]MDD1484055.1 hypothetical protein [Burkholderia thailandensis]MDD1489964.1 hypothetical protein [Burkholderia thailandensis]MDD1496306.1 hypothetical protein [Burkholderia thailandensis]
MDIYPIEMFCDRWISKADSYKTDNLEDLFDRFFTLFVAYNRLYSASAELHRATLDPRLGQIAQGDRREATTVMARLIQQSRFSDIVKENPAIAESCETISELLLNRRFFLHSVRNTREPDHARDERLAEGLQRHSILAVLECLYQIRCNIFHGEKEFAPRQAQLLAPAIVLLEAIVRLGRNVLRELVNIPVE